MGHSGPQCGTSRGARPSGAGTRLPPPLPLPTPPLLLLLVLLCPSLALCHVVHHNPWPSLLRQHNSSVPLPRLRGLRVMHHLYTPKVLRQFAAPQPCVGSTVTVPVAHERDFQLRLKYAPSRPVKMLVQGPLTLSQPLILGPNFSCTIIRAKPGAANPSISFSGQDQPVVVVNGTNNIWIQNVDIKHGLGTGAPSCALGLFVPGRESSSLVCPAVYIVSSFGVQINQGSVYGRIDIFRSASVSLDHLKVTGPKVYSSGGQFNSFVTHGFIRIGETASGTNLVGANIVVSNCEVYGGWELITLYRGAVGVTITRNYLHDFLFVGVRCGADTGYVMDCHNNQITNNYIWNPVAYASSITDVNNAGIYTCLHYFNPGNVISCNYIYNQRWCLYLDSASSGVTVDGGLCYGSYAAVKVNGGKYNKVRSLIVAMSSRFLHFISCVSVQFGNCFNPTGNNWEAMRRKYWNIPAINNNYPWMQTICNPLPSILNNVNCNPKTGKYNADTTGYCSGYSYGNDVQSVWFYKQLGDPYDYNSCLADTGVDCDSFNLQQTANVTSDPGFVGGGTAPALTDFGLTQNSRIYKLYPKFTSCPRNTVGPTTIVAGSNLPSYDTFWNIPRPAQFDAVVNFNFGVIFDTSQTVPLDTLKKNIQRTSRTVP